MNNEDVDKFTSRRFKGRTMIGRTISMHPFRIGFLTVLKITKVMLCVTGACQESCDALPSEYKPDLTMRIYMCEVMSETDFKKFCVMRADENNLMQFMSAQIPS